MKRSGIRDVAKAAGVSITTVSRALNGYSDVNEETRRKIVEISKKLNYVPNSNARSLVGKKNKTIALLMSGLAKSDESGIAFGTLSGMYHSSVENGCEFILLTTNVGQQKEMSYLQLCREKNIDGVVIEGLTLDDPYYNELIESEIPCVVIDINLSSDNVCSLSINNEEAAYKVVNYLLDCGHRHIALINGKENAEVSKKRFSGYAKALTESGILLDIDYMRYCNFEEELAYENTAQLLCTYPDITAFFCISDVMAMGCIRAINDCGKEVPKDISVIGFDDMPMAKYINGNGLTTIRQNPFNIGKKAGDILYKMINGKIVEKEHTASYEFVVRGTVKSINK